VNKLLHTVQIDLGSRSYPIYIGAGLLADAATYASVLPNGPVVIVTNQTVAPLYLAQIQSALGARSCTVCLLPDGERYKTQTTLGQVYDALAAAKMSRDGAVIALGGGVIGDIAGFAAATWARGIDVLQVPTTLLAQVDSSVGGKTAVNHPAGKNLIGAFHQPVGVIADLSTLSTLPDRELKAGLAEVIKYGLIHDVHFLEWIETSLPALLARHPDALAYAVQRSCQIKADIVARDERETGPRALLNFGHTFGHAIEAAAGYGAWLHGEAVATGMLLATRMSAKLGFVSMQDVARLQALLTRAGLPIDAPRMGVERALELMALDKKVLAGRVRLVLLEKLGTAAVSADYDPAVLRAVLQEAVG
jgi:3-dehydroquinate synthase